MLCSRRLVEDIKNDNIQTQLVLGLNIVRLFREVYDHETGRFIKPFDLYPERDVDMPNLYGFGVPKIIVYELYPRTSLDGWFDMGITRANESFVV